MHFRNLHTALLGATAVLLASATLQAQALQEKTNIRFFEHHSTMVTGADFGNGANADSSGYDLVKHEYVKSFNEATFEAWPANSPVPANIDMVEHNGVFGNGGNFGFTSGNSTIWQQNGPPYIRGNGTTLFMEAPSSFSYDAATDMSAIKNAFNASMASNSVQEVENGKVYLAKLRGEEQYVAIKVTNVVNDVPMTGPGNHYFTFNYKHVAQSSSIAGTEAAMEVSVYPNPAQSVLRISASSVQPMTSLRLMDVQGRIVLQQKPAQGETVEMNVAELERGMYFLEVMAGQERRVLRVELMQ